ncbi:hypothetical protein EXW39_28290 (plasmid) [Bacillus mycoides]|uniref:hypothetical protein n=1 Tax=Bacillus cereus group TaxID=86661 RepID=UPI0011C9C440|nr:MULTISPECIES: hypothetical protein [Bacillus cereus group]QWG81424.1 hypothetical protein EXW27_28430 [Bacillus mycoides]QWH63999.1 hypothetical protein EXW39_28290 [Bacillus mycoides]QWI78265.1 hypothetical protein JG486_29725 [Bacillus mycoides]TXR81459.1 hypothetical protein DN408_12910 [Bacillus sp. AR13-1]
MSFSFYEVFIIAGILAVQFFFSTRNNIYWGAILPVAYIAFLTGLFVTNRIENTIGFILYLLLGLLFLCAEWNGGRKYLHEKRKKELDKMKIYDMK